MLKRKKLINSEILKYISLVSQLGFVMISSILVLLIPAVFLERKFQTNGVLILIGVLFGVITGIFAVYKLLKRMLFEQDEKNGR